MILDSYLLEKVKKYCQVAGIPFSKDKFSSKNKTELQNFISGQTKKDRMITKRKEEDNKMSIGLMIKKMVGNVKVESPIEEYLCDALIQEDFANFETQYQIGKYRVDIAFVEYKLVVECDGQEYHFSDRQQIERDQARDKYLARKGWRVLHIGGLAIRRNIDLCIEKIREALGVEKVAKDKAV